MQKVLNYGSYLQAYALKQLLLNNGASEVYFIDIKPGKQLPGFSDADKVKSSFISKIVNAILSSNIISKIKDFFFIRQVFKDIIKNYKHLGLYDICPSKFDLAVIGSDEVFNCCQSSTWGYTLQLYGEIPEAKEVISYAASFGHTTLEQLNNLGIDYEIGKTLLTMSDISVRDTNSHMIVKSLTDFEPQVNVDPVLAYGYKKEIESYSIVSKDRFIVLYSYHTRISDQNEINRIVKFAKEKNLKVYSIFCRYDWCDKAILPDSPFEVLAWIKNAAYVITDTFHGTVFSIITRSQFATIIRDSNRNKLLSLLEHFGLADRIIDTCKEDFNSTFEKYIEYFNVDSILDSDRDNTNIYLRKHLTE